MPLKWVEVPPCHTLQMNASKVGGGPPATHFTLVSESAFSQRKERAHMHGFPRLPTLNNSSSDCEMAGLLDLNNGGHYCICTLV